MGMEAIFVMWPWLFEEIFVSRDSLYLDFIGSLASEEKMYDGRRMPTCTINSPMNLR